MFYNIFILLSISDLSCVKTRNMNCCKYGRGICYTRDTVTSPRDTSHVTPSIAADPRPTLPQQTNSQPEVRWGGVDTLCSVGRESHRSDYHSVCKHTHWPYIAQKCHGTTKFIYISIFKIYSNLMCRCQCQCVDF